MIKVYIYCCNNKLFRDVADSGDHSYLLMQIDQMVSTWLPVDDSLHGAGPDKDNEIHVHYNNLWRDLSIRYAKQLVAGEDY